MRQRCLSHLHCSMKNLGDEKWDTNPVGYQQPIDVAEENQQ